jgi:hypothetical protein
MQQRNHRKASKFVIIFLGILIPILSFSYLLKTPLFAATSDTINLQGKIVRNDTGYEGLNVSEGNPSCIVAGPANDTCDFRIRYYNASSGGTLLLTEEFSNIEIGQYMGVFNLGLGSDPSPTAGTYSSLIELIQGEGDVYVEVGFDPAGGNSYTEVFTRMPLQATAYAIRARYADNASGATEVPWSGLQDPTDDLTLEHATRKTLFNWATGTGTDDLFTLTSDASASGTGALLNIQTGVSSSLTPLRVRAGATEAIFVDNQGRVGIGTTTPGAKLDVGGNILVQAGGSLDTGAAGTLTIGGTTQTGLTLGRSGASTSLIGSNVTLGGVGYGGASNTLSFTSAGSSGQLLTSQGSGAPIWTSPGDLAVRWDSIINPTANQSLTMGTYDTAWNFTTGDFRITSDSNEALFVGGGNVGIGTTSPGRKLDVNGLGRFYSGDDLTNQKLVEINHSNNYYNDMDITGNLLSVNRDYTYSNIGSGNVVLDTQTIVTSGPDLTVSFSHTTGSGLNRALVVIVSTANNVFARTVDSITYDGESLTRLTRETASYTTAEIWYLVDPPTGTYDVVVTYPTNWSSYMYGSTIGATTWLGVDQASPFGTPETLSSTGGTKSIDVSTIEGQVVIDVWAQHSGNTNTVGAGQTAFWNGRTFSTSFSVGSSYKDADDITTNMYWTAGSGLTFAMVAAPLKPSSDANSLNLYGSLVSFSSNCTNVSGVCLDQSEILTLTQGYSSGTGAVLSIQNSGSGPDILFNDSPILRMANGGTMTWDNGTDTLMSLADDGTNANLFVNGRIGIGTASPSEKLHISGGDVRIDNMTTAGVVKNSATGVLSGGHTLGASDITTGSLVNGSKITMAGTLTDRLVGSGNVTVGLSDSAALSVIGNATNAAGAPTDIAAASDHQVLRRSGTSIGFGAINLGSANAVTGTLGVGSGGTGLDTYAIGDILYASGTGTLARRAIGTAGQILQVSSGVPTWVDVSTITEDNYVDSVSFSTTTGDLTVGRTGTLPDLTASLDGRYALSSSLYGNWVIKDSSGDTGGTVGSGEDVQMLGGTNITTTRSGRNVTFATVNNPSFSTSVTTPLIIGNGTTPRLAIMPSSNSTTAIQLQNAEGTSILNVDTTNSRIGIGTDNPTGYFHVNYTGPNGVVPMWIDASGSSISGTPAFQVRLPSSGDRKGFQITNSTDSYAWASFEWNAGGSNNPGFALGPGGSVARDVSVSRSGTGLLKLDSTNLHVTGNVGIGTASPSEKLHISGGNVRIDNMTTAGVVKNSATGVLSGGHTLGASDITTGSLVNGSKITMAGTLTDRLVGSGNVTVGLSDSAALSVIGNATNAAGAPTDIAAASDHQVLRRSGTSIGFGAINLGSTNAVTGTLGVGSGGTGLDTYAIGDILYASGTGTLARRAIGTAGQILQVSSGVPTWVDVSTITEDNYVDSVSFSTTTGDLTIGRTGTLPDLTASLDGRYALSSSLYGNWVIKDSSGDTGGTVGSGEDVQMLGGTNITTTRSGRNVTFATVNNPVFSTSVTTPLVTNAGTLTLRTTGSNVMVFETNSTERMRIDASGNLGIGTASPTHKLTIDGTGSLFNITSGGNSLFTVTDSQITSNLPHAFTSTGDVSMAYNLYFTNQTSSKIESYGPFSIVAGEAHESNNLTLKTYNSGRLLVDSYNFTSDYTGIGIGTSTPSYALDVSGGTGIVGRFSGRVVGGEAVEDDEFVTKSQLDTASSGGVASITGTANRVLVNGTSGTPQTGAVTLTAPQDIDSTATPQFARLGLSTAANGTYHLNLGGALVHGTATGLGIGTTTPSAKLHVVGNEVLVKNATNAATGVTIDSGDTTAQRSTVTFKDRGTDIFGLEKTATNAFQLYDYEGTGVSRFLVDAGANSGISLRTKGTGNFSFINDTTTHATITSTGRLGIGTPSPSYLLHVNGGTGIVAQFSGRVRGVDAVNTDEFVTKSQLDSVGGGIPTTYWALSGSDLYPTSTSYKVGVGTTTPAANFHVAGSSTTLANLGNTLYVDSTNNMVGIGGSPSTTFHLQQSSGWNQMYMTNAGTTGAQNQLWFATGYGGSEKWAGIGHFDSDGALRFSAAGNLSSPQMILLTNGRLGIGTATPSYAFHVNAGTGIVGQFSGRVIGADAVNTNEFVTKSQLDAVGGGIPTTYWERPGSYVRPLNANDSILPNTSGDLGAAGTRWNYVYGNYGSFGSVVGNTTLTLQPSTDAINSVRISNSTGTEILSVDTTNSRVGIGTTAPSVGARLEVNGQVKITGGDPALGKVLTSDAAGLASWESLGTLNVVTSLTGITNQIDVSASTGDVTLSIPTDFRAPGTVNAVQGLYTGAGAGTQRVDASGNLLNIGIYQYYRSNNYWRGRCSF